MFEIESNYFILERKISFHNLKNRSKQIVYKNVKKKRKLPNKNLSQNTRELLEAAEKLERERIEQMSHLKRFLEITRIET